MSGDDETTSLSPPPDSSSTSSEGNGFLSRFFGYGRAIADSVRILDEGNDDDDDDDIAEEGDGMDTNFEPLSSSSSEEDGERSRMLESTLRSFYEAYNPEKVKEIKKILDLFRGREKSMFESLRKKYDVDEDAFEALLRRANESVRDEIGEIKKKKNKKNRRHKKKKRTVTYSVPSSGATLMGVALHHNCSMRTLRRLNPELKYQAKLLKGQQLIVPVHDTKTAPTQDANARQAVKDDDDDVLVVDARSPGPEVHTPASPKHLSKTVHVPVEFCAVGCNVHGTLLISPDFLMFEPAANDVIVRHDGILAYQFCIDIRDVLRVGVVSYMPDDDDDDDTAVVESENNGTITLDSTVDAVRSKDRSVSAEKTPVSSKTSTVRQSSPSIRTSRPFGGSFLQLFWAHRGTARARPSPRRRLSDTEKYVIFQVSRSAIPSLVSTIHKAIKTKRDEERDVHTAMPINFTSDGGGMLRAIRLDELFQAIDRNRSMAFTEPVEMITVTKQNRSRFDVSSPRDSPIRRNDGTNEEETTDVESGTISLMEKTKKVERIRSSELMDFKATFVGESELLKDRTAIQVIDDELPPSLRGESWQLLYSLVRDGQSFSTFLSSVKNKGPTIVVVKSEYGDVFGGYASQSWAVKRRGFFGTGECFLFRIALAGKVDSVAWRWTGMNDDFMMCTIDSIAMGCGENAFGFYLGEDFLRGNSSHCATFGNERLTSEADFGILAVEVWGLTD